MKKSKLVYHFSKMTVFDVWSSALYALLSLFLLCFYKDDDCQTQRSVIGAYCVGTHIGLYAFYYKPLRNLSTYMVWVGFSIMHLGLYFYLNQNTCYASIRSNGIKVLVYTLPVLILFQILRWLNFKMQGVELVAPSKHGYDIWGERKPNLIDFICFVVFIVTYLGIALNT